MSGLQARLEVVLARRWCALDGDPRLLRDLLESVPSCAPGLLTEFFGRFPRGCESLGPMVGPSMPVSDLWPDALGFFVAAGLRLPPPSVVDSLVSTLLLEVGRLPRLRV